MFENVKGRKGDVISISAEGLDRYQNSVEPVQDFFGGVLMTIPCTRQIALTGSTKDNRMD